MIFVPYLGTVKELDRLRQSLAKYYATSRGSTDERVNLPGAIDAIEQAIRSLGGHATGIVGYDCAEEPSASTGEEPSR